MVVAAICFSTEVVKRMEKQFEMSVSVVEGDANLQLPAIEDVEIIISIEGDSPRKDTLATLRENAVFRQIPGRMRGKTMTLKVRNAKCFEIDTVIPVQQQISVRLHRNPDYYGKIKVFVIKDDERLCNQWVSVEGIKSKTNEDGVLQMNIPLSNQRENYYIEYGEYCGTLPMPCIGTECIELKK